MLWIDKKTCSITSSTRNSFSLAKLSVHPWWNPSDVPAIQYFDKQSKADEKRSIQRNHGFCGQSKLKDYRRQDLRKSVRERTRRSTIFWPFQIEFTAFMTYIGKLVSNSSNVKAELCFNMIDYKKKGFFEKEDLREMIRTIISSAGTQNPLEASLKVSNKVKNSNLDQPICGILDAKIRPSEIRESESGGFYRCHQRRSSSAGDLHSAQ